MPPRVPPFPMRTCHKTSPSLSGSMAWTIPDFWPATSIRFPFENVTRIGEVPKSKSGPLASGQLLLSAMRHAMFHTSEAVICRDHRSFPESRSIARNASLVGVEG